MVQNDTVNWTVFISAVRICKAAVILFQHFITNSQKKDGIFWMAGIMLLLLPIVGLVGTNNLEHSKLSFLNWRYFSFYFLHPSVIFHLLNWGMGTVFISYFLGGELSSGVS